MKKLTTIAITAIAATLFVSCATLPEYTAKTYEAPRGDWDNTTALQDLAIHIAGLGYIAYADEHMYVAFENLDIRPDHYKSDSKKAAKAIRKHLKEINHLHGTGGETHLIAPDKTNLKYYRKEAGWELLPDLLNQHKVVASVYIGGEFKSDTRKRANVVIYSDKSPKNDKTFEWRLYKTLKNGEELKWQ